MFVFAHICPSMFCSAWWWGQALPVKWFNIEDTFIGWKLFLIPPLMDSIRYLIFPMSESRKKLSKLSNIQNVLKLSKVVMAISLGKYKTKHFNGILPIKAQNVSKWLSQYKTDWNCFCVLKQGRIPLSCEYSLVFSVLLLDIIIKS